MRIGLVVPGGVDPSGVRRVIPALLWLIERLAAVHDVHVFALFQDGAPPRYPLLGAEVDNIGRRNTALRAFAAILREHRRRPFDVLHAFWGFPAGLLTVATARMIRRPSVVHLFGGELASVPEAEYGEQRTSRGQRRIRRVLNGATRLTVQSRPQLDWLEARGFTAERLPLGVDLRAWPVRPPCPRDGTARLIHVASLNRIKDQDTLIGAAARLAATGMDFTLDVIGEDTLGGQIQAVAHTARLEDRVRFHGFLEQDRVREYMQRAHVLVMSSRSEAGPIVLAEAAASGVPAAGTRVGQFAEWAPDAALAVDIGDTDALAAAVQRLLDDDACRRNVAKLAQARAIAEDADWSAARISRLYEEVARG